VRKHLINPYTGYACKNHTGKKYGKLKVLEPDFDFKWPFTSNRGIVWKCECECGNIKHTLSKYLVDGTVASCGCANGKKIKK
jgi:hypothetical protein